MVYKTFIYLLLKSNLIVRKLVMQKLPENTLSLKLNIKRINNAMSNNNNNNEK